MTIVFKNHTIGYEEIINLFLRKYFSIKKGDEKVSTLQLVIENSVEIIDELLYSYLMLFRLEFPQIDIEVVFNNSNPKLFQIAKNKIKLIKNCTLSSQKKIDERIVEEKSITPLVIINKDTITRLFYKNNFYIDTKLILKNNKKLLSQYINRKDDFFIQFKNLKQESLIWQYYLAILDDLSILRRFYYDENIPIDFRVDDYDKALSEYYVKNVFDILYKNNFFEFSEIEIYLFRVFTDKIKPKRNQYNSIEKINQFIKKIEYCINYIKNISSGIEELARNIVEHSGDKKDSGFGVFSARVFSKEKFKNIKYSSHTFTEWISSTENEEFILDLNIIDSGNVDIRTSYIEKIKHHNDSAFDNDLEKLNNEKISILFDFDNIQLVHQVKREMARLGLLIFSNEVLSKNGFIQFTTNGLNTSISESVNLFYKNKKIIDSEDIKIKNPIGTSYNFIIPLSKFKEINSKKINDISSTPYFSLESTKELYDYQYLTSTKKESNKIYLKNLSLNIESYTSKYEKVNNLCESILENLDKDEILVLDTSEDIFTSTLSSPSDWLRFLAVIQLNNPIPIIFLGNNKFFENIYQEIIKINIFFSRSSLNFWNDSANLLFYFKIDYHEDDKNVSIWFNNILTGNKFENYISINSNISNYHFNTVVFSNSNFTDINDSERIKDNAFFRNGKLLSLELIIRSKKGEILFLETVQSLLNLEITPWRKLGNDNKSIFFKQLTGYKISEAHFKLGSKIHIKDFYYAKPMFYNSFYANRFAFILSRYIIDNHLKNIDSNEEVTIIGYENYSELLVSQIRNKINEYEGNKRIKHDIVVNEGVLKNTNNINGNIILIVPISSTFSTQQKLFNLLKKINLSEKRKNNVIQNNNSNINNTHSIPKKIKPLFPDLSVLLVADNKIETDFINSSLKEKKENQNSELHPNKRSIYEVFNWQKQDGIILANRRAQHYFINVFTDWHLNYKCGLCFPKIHTNKEKCLLDTEVNSVTPDLVFDLPKISVPNKDLNVFDLLFNNPKSSDNKYAKISEEESDCFNVITSPLKRRSHNYRFYIKTSSFLHKSKSNNDKIRSWLFKLRNEHFNENKKIVLLKQSEISVSGFVDMVNKIVFDDTATILQFSPKDDNVQNFIKFHEDLLKNAQIIYIDDVLAYGKYFALINNYVKNLNSKASKINYFITFCNKMNYYDERILKEDLGAENLFAFCKINIPSLLNSSEQEFFSKKIEIYEKLMTKSLLDRSRIYFSEKKERLITKDLDKDGNEPNSNPIGLFKSLLYHEIFSFFSFDENKNEYINKELVNLFLNKTSKVALAELINKIKNSDSIKSFINEFPFFIDEIDINIIRIIAEPPFSRYKYLKEAAFDWTAEKLKRIHFEKDNYFTYKSESSLFCKYQRDKLLLAIAVNLNINYLFSKDFLIKIRSLINKLNGLKDSGFKRRKLEFNGSTWFIKEDLEKGIFNYEGFITFYSSLVQELIYEDDAKAAELVQNIASIINQGIHDSEKKPLRLTTDFHDSYIYLMKILVYENNFIFENFFENFYKEKFNKVKSIGLTSKESTDGYVEKFYQKYRSEALEIMLGNLKKDEFRIDEGLEKTFYDTIDLKVRLKNEKENKLSINKKKKKKKKNKYPIKDKVYVMLESLCKILNIREGGAYLTIRYENKDVNSNNIKIDDLYTINQYATSKDYELDTKLEDEKSIMYKIFKGIKDSSSKKPKSTFELYKKDNKAWDFKPVTNCPDTNNSNCEKINFNDCRETSFIFKNDNAQYKNLFFLRISDINENEIYGDNTAKKIFEAQPIAVITFYANDIFRANNSQSIHFDPKNIRFLLLLRDYIKDFIKGQTDNDSLAGFITEEERNKFQLTLKHGLSIYKDSFDGNLELLLKKIKENNEEETIENQRGYLDMINSYYSNKINFIYLFHTNLIPKEYYVSNLIDEFKNYPFILGFYHPRRSCIKDSKLIDYKNFTHTKTYSKIIKFPELFYPDLIFELIYNIRKHSKIKSISNQNKLKIRLKIVEKQDHFEIKLLNNNTKKNKSINQEIIQKNNVDGIDLINLIIKKQNPRNTINICRRNNLFLIVLKIYKKRKI